MKILLLIFITTSGGFNSNTVTEMDSLDACYRLGDKVVNNMLDHPAVIISYSCLEVATDD